MSSQEGNEAFLSLMHCPRDYTGDVQLPIRITSIDVSRLAGRKGITGFTGSSMLWGCITLNGMLCSPERNILYCAAGYSGVVTIGDYINSIADNAFADCAGITAFEVEEDNETFSAENGILLSARWQ